MGHQAMNETHCEDRGCCCEDAGRTRYDHSDIHAVVQRTVANRLASFGIEEDDRKELRADLQHLRHWRKIVEQAQNHTFKIMITIIVTGLVGTMWLGIKVTLGK